MPDYTSYDIIDFSLNNNPAEVVNAFNQLISNKIADLIQARRQEVVQTMFNAPNTNEANEEASSEGDA